MSHEFRIKPLSEGLGLGTLRTSATRRVHRAEQPRVERQRPIELPTIEIERMERGQAAEHDAGEINRRQTTSDNFKHTPKTHAIAWLTRAMVGWGLDGLMVCLTVAICAVLGLMAWRFGGGYTQTIDPFDAVGIIVKFISLRGFKLLGIVVAVAWIFYWVVMKALVGSTLGTSLAGSNRR